ncbi:Ketol-acid reductoisomerase chloroplastic [Zea mays]|uniref:Ketol-acid reductoisomerase chloroplastic n=1 Tax=Zea mays TaxID=4577 RepID=A0A1D6IPJ1_MAIZE|nr:Ketol-acid reductoisomerase chloroplastic [Zea mays]
MEVSSRLQSLLRPFLLCRSRAAGMTLQTLALCSPPPPPRIPSSFLLRTRRLPPPFPHGGPSRLLFHSTFASVSPAPAPAPGRDHLNSKEQGPPPAPLPPPPPEELASEDESYYHEHLLEVAQENQSRVVPVKAFFLCTRVETCWVGSYLILSQGFKSGVIDESHCHYMVVFQYGSIVLFNVSDHEADGYLKIVEKHASGLLPEMRKDDYAVVEKPTLETWMQGGLDYIVLRDLSIDGIRTIGSVLGQSIALDYYIRQVDGMVAEFTDINRGMEKTGTFTMERKKLFQLVGKANSNLADVILKLGLFERSDIAWKNANYAQIWEYLRDEYELTQRFGNLDFKLKFVEHNIRFLQEILQNRKSDFLEWLIIILISVEILISVYNIIQEQM